MSMHLLERVINLQRLRGSAVATLVRLQIEREVKLLVDFSKFGSKSRSVLYERRTARAVVGQRLV